MARRIWKDRVVEFSRRFKDQNNNILELTPMPGTILEEGTPVNAANLNGLEEDLETHITNKVKHRGLAITENELASLVTGDIYHLLTSEPKIIPIFNWEAYQNVALGSNVTVSSVLGANTGDKAVDGNKTDGTSRWISDTADTSPWLEIDFGAECLIDKINFYSGNGYPSTTMIVPNYRFQYYKNGQWITLVSIINNMNYQRTHEFDETRTNKIRLDFPGQTGNQRIYEIEVFGQRRIL